MFEIQLLGLGVYGLRLKAWGVCSMTPWLGRDGLDYAGNGGHKQGLPLPRLH